MNSPHMPDLNEAQAIQRVTDLISIPGGSCSEHEVSDWLQQQLLKLGVPKSAISSDTAHRKSPAGGTTGNLIVKLKGTIRAPRRLLMAHMDTVPLAVGCQPVRDDDVIRPASRSTALGGDNRAGCAAVLTAVAEILQRKLDYPPLTLLFTVQEEIGLRGARFLTAGKLGQPKLCFNWDGRDPATLVTGAVGATNVSVRIAGIASHAGVHPEDGINAGVVASLALAELQRNGWHGLIEKAKQRGASNVGILRGGAATNVVMPELALEAEVRSHSSSFRRRILREWRRAFTTAAGEVRNSAGQQATVQFDEDTRYEAFRLKSTEPCLKEAERAVRDLGLEPISGPCDGGLDANWITTHGFPTVTLGCGQHNIHTVDEFLSLPEFLTGCRLALRLGTGEQ